MPIVLIVDRKRDSRGMVAQRFFQTIFEEEKADVRLDG